VTDTTTTTTPEPEDGTTAEPDATEPEPADDTTADPARRARAEARRLRERLHATEAERDTLAGLVDGYRRRDAEQAAETAGLAAGADLWAGGADLADFLAEEGHVDPARVAETVKALLAERPHWARRPHGTVDQGPRGPATPARTWHDALTGR